MCQRIGGCQHQYYHSGECMLSGPCPFEMTEAEIVAWMIETDEDAEADYRHENLEALKRREEV